ncbi:hypothetical protein ACIO1C_15365 [Streptomyces sp. NPDC087420]|uniref:hypothetical protein n=1 Tax=Streptomyces sp. NPDC087420 TaxID=3365785 RepID=UPI0038345193
MVMAGVAVVGLLLGFFGLPAAGLKSPTGAAQPTVTVTATETKVVPAPDEESGSEGQDPAATPSPKTTSSVRWHGDIHVTAYHWDLDTVPPAEDSPITGDFLLFETLSEGTAEFDDYKMAPVPEGENPTQGECTSLAQLQAKDELSVSAGQSVCLITQSGRTALMKVKSVNDDDTVEAEITVWEK